MIIKRFKEEACGNREIYASQWAEDSADEMVKYFDRLKRFFEETAGKRSAMLRHIGWLSANEVSQIFASLDEGMGQIVLLSETYFTSF